MARFNKLGRPHDDIGHLAIERILSILTATYYSPKVRRFVLNISDLV